MGLRACGPAARAPLAPMGLRPGRLAAEGPRRFGAVAGRVAPMGLRDGRLAAEGPISVTSSLAGSKPLKVMPSPSLSASVRIH